jgi:hypothetical protein
MLNEKCNHFVQKDWPWVADCLSERLIIFLLREILPFSNNQQVYLQQRAGFAV